MRYIGSIFCLTLAAAPAAAQADGIKFKPLIDARLRYEHVEQAGIASDAEAVTMRLRAGGEVKSGRFAFLAEAEGTLAIDEDYNSGVNGKGTFPIVADPENIELNRIQLQYKSKATAITVGRQRINLDDQRFVGNVGWRQNEQTFDAARIEYTGVKNLKVDLTYALGVQTIWGIDGGSFGATNRPTRIEGDNVFANVSYKFKPGTLTVFAYLVDQDEPVVALLRNSSQTYGARFAGGMPLSKDIKLSYLASYARQSDDKGNPVSYTADYVAGELGLEAYGFKLTGGYELLGADPTATGIPGGNFAFQTPYATLHKFNGWADKFLTTPQTGLQDYYAGLSYTLPKVGKMGPLVANVVFHRFDSDMGSIHYGDEWNASISLKLTKRTTAMIKYADYQREGIASFAGDADTKKFWAQIEYAL
ncbi:MAG TPA: alginate export family protein [Sphingobium sp.]|nr:alginate export family protein [Sphingobium sp.]